MHLRSCNISCRPEQTIDYPFYKGFNLSDRDKIKDFLDRFAPMSCEYNFANLFSWNDTYEHLWTWYKNRILIYDQTHNQAFMPLGKAMTPKGLVKLSSHLTRMGLNPDINLVCKDYLEFFPEIERDYEIQEIRDHAEYLYLTEKLYSLNGNRLHKKRNLISQFKKRYPGYRIEPIHPGNSQRIKVFARFLLDRIQGPATELENEYKAISRALDYFDELEMGGLGLFLENQVVAFSLFSRLNCFTYNIQFEKSDISFKGAAQVINQETAGFLRDRCLYLNREQDLGIRGLRQAKMSYEPEILFVPYQLKFIDRS